MKDNLSLYEHTSDASPLSIVSIPLELGSDERGLARAPQYLFERGLQKMLASIGREIRSHNTVACPSATRVASAGRMKHAREIAQVARAAAPLVERAARDGIVLGLGGDHSASIGSLAGAAARYPSLGVIYIDSHPDCNTAQTSITGNVHGMVTSALMGEGDTLLTSIARRHIEPEHFLYIGLKDFDAAEIEYLRTRGLPCVTMLDIATRGLALAVEAIQALSRRVDALWIEMDMDSIDEAYAPGVGLPAHSGLTRREALALAQYIGATAKVAGIDVVEICPERDAKGKTAALALELIARFLGSEYSWYQREYIDTYRETNVTQEAEKVAVKRGPTQGA